MTARYPGSFLISILLHGMFAGVLVYSAHVFKDEALKMTKVFELVAGEGDNYAATEAPALGVEGGVKFPNLPPLPVPPAPAPEPEPVSPVEPAAPEPPAPSPVQAVAPPKPAPSQVKKAEPKPVPKAEPQVPDFKKSMQRKQNAMAAKQKAQREKERKAAAAAEAARLKAELAAKQKAAAAGGATKYTKIDAEGIAKGVVGGSTANKTGGAGGKALSREEQNLLDTYLALLKLRLGEVHEKPDGLSEALRAEAECYVSASGAISKARITKSSGSADFDQSVLAAFGKVRSIGPRPDEAGGTVTFIFRMKEED